MKLHIFRVGLISFISVGAFGQAGPQQTGPFGIPTSDPFEAMEIYMRSIDSNSPGSNSPSAANTNGSAAVVSLQELQHKVPKQAIKEYNKASEALKKGKNAVAKEHLQEAVNIDPQFADAHNNLGVVIGKLGNFDQAASEFQKAIDSAPRNSTPVANLSVVLYIQKRYHEVCGVARKALELNSSLLGVRYVLAFSLVALHINNEETLANLERVASQFPEAHVAASNVLQHMGRPQDAARHLEAYLRVAPKDDPTKPLVEARLAELRQ